MWHGTSHIRTRNCTETVQELYREAELTRASFFLEEEIQCISLERRLDVLGVLEVQQFLGGTHRVPLEEVFRDLGAFLHAHEHLREVAQRVSPQGFHARGRV